MNARNVTNRQANNMQVSMNRVYGPGPGARRQIDRDSGTTFSDGAPHYTTGHHNVRVTEPRARAGADIWAVSFHRDGAYVNTGTHPAHHLGTVQGPLRANGSF
ncbi:hypothetical protein tinsulaeT_37070 [Thalassotalea insulae]|uniref:Uncharacterized protein n=1 Tax=Thalassotalea insulae TaxID=2056778 RepID=A0ABQ6GWY2_9GAMM|nr:hypothetical protein tinsulaeT_37070 [Thalassotalea insulae]